MPTPRQLLDAALLAAGVLSCFPELAFCQSGEQTYIFIRPAVLTLSESKPEGEVQFTCRQLPVSASVSGQEILLMRRSTLEEDSTEVTLASVSTSTGLSSYISKIKVAGDPNKELVATLTATCADGSYTYSCSSTLMDGEAQKSSATFTINSPPPSISLRARPRYKYYTKATTVTLTCSSGSDIIGIGTNGIWMWEFNDETGPWKVVHPSYISGGIVSTTGQCFQTAQPTQLKVKLEDLTKQNQARFRCFFQHGQVRAVDDAREFLLSTGYGKQAFRIIGTDPVVAIVSILACICILCLLVYVCFQLSSRYRMKKKIEREENIGLRILSPMTPAQRDRLLKERLQDAPPPPPLMQPEESSTATDMDSSEVDPEDITELAGDEEEKKKKKKKKKQDAQNLVVILDTPKNADVEEISDSDESTVAQEATSVTETSTGP